MSKIQKITKKCKKYGLRSVMKQLLNKVLNVLFFYAGKLFFAPLSLKNVIIIESHNDFDCNGGAFYQYLLTQRLNKKYRIVWIIKNRKPDCLPPNVVCFDYIKASLVKEYYCNIAKYILNDDKFIPKRKAKQKSVYCTHGGITFKNVKGLISVPEYIDCILCSSERYAPLMCANYQIPYPNGKMLYIGFPANDYLFTSDDMEYRKITNKKYIKCILWMPTFRKNSETRNDSSKEMPYGIPLIEGLEQLEEIDCLLSKHNSALIIKIHPMQLKETYQNLKGMKNIYILDGDSVKEHSIDNYRLMKSCDAMISDFSSAPYSFILLNRPIAFELSDFSHYKLGFSVDNIDAFLPGERLNSIDDFKEFILNVLNNEDTYKEERCRLVDWLYRYKDGDSCRRLAEYLGL
ncbi:CDP-glycerol glycerophosphotransferase family protein [uncultured Acetatifactor sp.]|jgi:CDP-glycerol glycerophosphotransferase (TagB/SpsB family)|uniref:CDP-glycerol glycerophosphotransferase family protein n=1 Tax=uncultured Acetatifactor sp. TaxID=1671927 RepID=UPI002605EF11|nr:CDP-glycerol glycerophosphotransferase family protein [uncultured Acetatifactor sp.]